MNPTTSIRAVAVAYLSTVTLGCAPIYTTRYDFTAPETPVGQVCATQCRSNELRCREIENLQYRHCETLQHLERVAYDECMAKKKSKKWKRRHCSGPRQCRSPSFESCESDHRQCHQACGGFVATRRECVLFCN